MGIFSTSKRVGKFVFVKMPASIFGIGQIRSNSETIAQLYASLKNPVCPQCAGGVLSIRDDDAEDGPGPNRMYTWACNRCDFMILGARDAKSLAPALTAMRQQQSLETFDDLDPATRAKYVSIHTLHSRIFFGAALAMLLGFAVMVFSGAKVLLSMNWLMLAGCMFIFGLKKSYRAWQVENGVLYVPGAFKSWFDHERWFR